MTNRNSRRSGANNLRGTYIILSVGGTKETFANTNVISVTEKEIANDTDRFIISTLAVDLLRISHREWQVDNYCYSMLDRHHIFIESAAKSLGTLDRGSIDLFQDNWLHAQSAQQRGTCISPSRQAKKVLLVLYQCNHLQRYPAKIM